MKLAAIYNVWDGLEHLDKSISLIYPFIDHVILVWQDVSNFGELNTDTSICVQALSTKYPKVTHSYFTPDIQKGGTHNEIAKRFKGSMIAKDLGCTHFLHIDTDEYYVPSDFEHGKAFVLEHNLDTSYCKLVTYFKQPNYRLEPLENYYVPFICKITSCNIGGFGIYTDPTRGTSPQGRCKEVPILMHHMSYVRNDIAMKLRNSSARVNIKEGVEKRMEKINNWQLGQPHPFMPQYKIVERDNLIE
jgi:hypothetical protein